MASTNIQKSINQVEIPTIIAQLLWLTAAVTVCTATILIVSDYRCQTTCYSNGVLIFLMTAGACLIGGVILGFLFAIPRSNKTNSESKDIRAPYYSDNTNLEEISDWLTKIIVGVSLTQLPKILDRIHGASSNLAAALSPTLHENSAYYALAYTTIIYFSLCGFGVGYVWTRVVFPVMLSRVKLNDYKKLADVAEAALMKKDIIENASAHIETELENPEQLDPEFKDVLIRLREQVTKALMNKPVKVTDDLQKGRWGGKSERNGKRLAATVSLSKNLIGYYCITIRVENADGSPLNTPAVVFVHDSYDLPHNAVYINPKEDGGRVQFDLLGYEAFTLGALLEDGTELELDLNEQTGYPADFYWGKAKQQNAGN
jgi:hypothetical protein